MSKLDPGTYFIYNRLQSSEGEQLAIRFIGEGYYARIFPFSYHQDQKWIIKDFGDGVTQTISPIANPGLQAAWGEDGVKVLPAGTHAWTIRSSESGYTINNGDPSFSWGIEGSRGSGNVTIGRDTGSEKQRWIFQRS